MTHWTKISAGGRGRFLSLILKLQPLHEQHGHHLGAELIRNAVSGTVQELLDQSAV